MDIFRTKAQVAEYLKISRMTLNRWEKKNALPDTAFGPDGLGLAKSFVNKWYQELREKYRPYNSWSKDRITKET